MISADEARQAVELEDRYVILPAHPWWQHDNWAQGKPVPDGFAYSSNNNEQWLTPEDLQRMIDES